MALLNSHKLTLYETTNQNVYLLVSSTVTKQKGAQTKRDLVWRAFQTSIAPSL